MSVAGTRNKDGTKGWHDAGDYNKYTVNAGVTVGSCFAPGKISVRESAQSGLDLPESGGTLPDFLAEIEMGDGLGADDAGG